MPERAVRAHIRGVVARPGRGSAPVRPRRGREDSVRSGTGSRSGQQDGQQPGPRPRRERAVRTERRGWLPSAALTLLLLSVVGYAAVRYQPQGSALAAWWPSSGIAVAYLARSPRRGRPPFL